MADGTARWAVIAWTDGRPVVLAPTGSPDAASRTCARVQKTTRASAQVVPLLPVSATTAQLREALGSTAARRPPWRA